MPSLLASLASAPRVNQAGVAVSLIGAGSAWTPGTPGAPGFTLSGGSGASIASQAVQDATHATLAIATGSASGALTISDPSTGATATVLVLPASQWLPRRR